MSLSHETGYGVEERLVWDRLVAEGLAACNLYPQSDQPDS